MTNDKILKNTPFVSGIAKVIITYISQHSSVKSGLLNHNEDKYLSMTYISLCQKRLLKPSKDFIYVIVWKYINL